MQYVSPSTINKELAAMSALCKWAAKQGYCREIKIKRFPPKLTKAPLPQVISKDEVLKIIEQVKPDRRGVVAAMYYGGLRSSEARHLRREDINLDKGLMLIRGKGNKQRVVPIIAPLRPYLEQGKAKKGYLWINKRTGRPWVDIRAELKGAAKRAGVDQRVYAHLLRHCFGTHATESGMGLRAAQEIMGHSSSQITELYTTLAAAQLIKEMNKTE
jgi:site-specific recombinase XerD